ncbi:hypothetical protein JCM10212_006142 [Sporobolomyces blumeae]
MPASRSPRIPVLNISDDPYRHQPSASTSSAYSRAPTSPRIRQSTSSPAPASHGRADSRPSSAPSSIYFPPLLTASGSKRMTAGLLPLGGTGGAGTRQPRDSCAWVVARVRGSRLKWIVVVFGAVALLVWSSKGATTDGEARAPAMADRLKGVNDLVGTFNELRRPEPTNNALGEEGERPIPNPAPARPPRPLDRPRVPPVAPEPQPVEQPTRDTSPSPDTSPIDVSVRPRTARATPPDRGGERYLAYSPHSGYHNQRISLENALTLAYLLDRTLLLPPIWLGHAIPYISFDKLQRRLEMASKTGLQARCIPYGDESDDVPVPRECEGFWDWTKVDWDFLVDLGEAEKLVKVERRWNLSLEWMEDSLGIEQAKSGKGGKGDVYSLKDDTLYQYRFYDSKDDPEPLDKWTTRIDVEDFKAKTDPYKLVHVGTMFGTSRLRTSTERAFDARSTFRRSMVFRNAAVDEVTEEVRDLLGGEGRYYGLHLRVGDGIFQKDARKNMRGVWDKLCRDKMKIDPAICDELRDGGLQADLGRRDQRTGAPSTRDDPPSTMLTKRANSRPQREGAYHHAPLPPLPRIVTRADSPLSSTLGCRRPLHTSPSLLPFNAPLYIATDSKMPLSDPSLSHFFSAFPCAFTLADFSNLASLDRMNRLRNEDDKTPLAQFLYPQLDAQIAAWGRGLVGTPQSTYSRFAIDVLHQMYHGWDIVERG